MKPILFILILISTVSAFDRKLDSITNAILFYHTNDLVDSIDSDQHIYVMKWDITGKEHREIDAIYSMHYKTWFFTITAGDYSNYDFTYKKNKSYDFYEGRNLKMETIHRLIHAVNLHFNTNYREY